MESSILELLKNSIPVLTFFLGAVFAPMVESNKQKFVTKRILKSFQIEMKDEVVCLESHIKSVAKALSNLKALNADQFNVKHGFIKFVPRPIKLHLLRQVQENAFATIMRNQRTTLKALEIQLSYLEEIRGKLINAAIDKEGIAEVVCLKKKWLYTSACLLYSINTFLNHKNVKPSAEVSDEAVVNSVMESLGVNVTYSNLLTYRRKSIF